jgi:hypothetical protein
MDARETGHLPRDKPSLRELDVCIWLVYGIFPTSELISVGAGSKLDFLPEQN